MNNYVYEPSLKTFFTSLLLDKGYDLRNVDQSTFEAMISKEVKETLSKSTGFCDKLIDVLEWGTSDGYIINFSAMDRRMIPDCIGSAIYPDWIPSGKKITPPTDPVVRNESYIYFYNDIERMNRFIMNYNHLWKNSSVGLEQLHLTIRLYIPKEYFNYMDKDTVHVIYKKPLMYNGGLLFENMTGETGNLINEMKSAMTVSRYIYTKTNNECYLMGNTIYEALISTTIKEWGKLINSLYCYEKTTDHPVLSYILYFLQEYKDLFHLFNVDFEKVLPIWNKRRSAMI